MRLSMRGDVGSSQIATVPAAHLTLARISLRSPTPRHLSAVKHPTTAHYNNHRNNGGQSIFANAL